MGELTIGEKMYISEAGKEWKRLINSLTDIMGNIPAEVSARIEKLYNSYNSEFSEYYKAEAEKEDIYYSDEVLEKFDKEWDKKHPEFYDLSKLFDGCDKEILEKYKEEIYSVQSKFN